MFKVIEAACASWHGKLLLIWMGFDGLLYLGALLTLVLAITDAAYRPLTYGFTIALVTSWAARMAYGIWLELRRVHHEAQAKAMRMDDILRRHGLSADQSEAIARELKELN